MPSSVTYTWMKLVKRCGLHGIRLHDARHTHASLLLKQDVHPKIVQERLGHGSIQITLDTYSHVAPGLQQAADNKFVLFCQIGGLPSNPINRRLKSYRTHFRS
ncbi:tyrosine-type recombinase/integrase [Chloroflexota bacterium]